MILTLRRLALTSLLSPVLVLATATNAHSDPPLVKDSARCGQRFDRADFHRAAKKVHRDSHRTRPERRRLHRVVSCQAAPRKSGPILRMHARRYRRAWRSRYRWVIGWRHVDPALKRRLYVLRECESTHNYRAVNGSYSGAYQYHPDTWARAGGHGYPADAPPREQDVRTAWFWPSHVGEWACRA